MQKNEPDLHTVLFLGICLTKKVLQIFLKSMVKTKLDQIFTSLKMISGHLSLQKIHCCEASVMMDVVRCRANEARPH